MSNQDQYGLVQDDDPSAEEYSETVCVNITDEVVNFTIASTPGSPPRKYRLAPFGKNGSSVSLQSGYCKPYKGAGGHHMLEPIIERKTRRHVWPQSRVRDAAGVETLIETPRLPMVVRQDRADEARAAWLAAARRKPSANAKPVTFAVQLDEQRRPVSATIVQAPLVGEEVGDDEIEAPPPDPDDPIDLPTIGADEEPPPEVPPRAKRGGGRS